MVVSALEPEYPILQLCKVLGVCRSSYYAWAFGKTYVRSPGKEAVAQKVKEVFEAHKRRYGTRRIEVELKAEKMAVGRYQIRRRMQEMGLKAIQPKSYVPKTTQTNPNLKRSPNLLLEMDSVDSLNQVWVGDITYLPLAGSTWAYLATWMDLNSRMIVGWKVSASMESDIIFDSFKTAVKWRCPKVGLVVHSDGGGQYMEGDFRAYLGKMQFRQSMTRVDNHYDNAFAESLFSRFKAELLLDKQVFKGLADARAQTFEFIEGYYNPKRRHSRLGYLSPREYESNWYRTGKGISVKLNMIA